MTAEPTPTPPPARRQLTLEDLNRLAPGLGTIMPEIGTRCWKLYYAAKAGNWTMAQFQVGEIQGLMLRGAFTRPAYESDLKSYIEESWSKVRESVASQDFAAFDTAFRAAIDMANDYHDGVGRGYIVWKLPEMPPPDLDLTPRQ